MTRTLGEQLIEGWAAGAHVKFKSDKAKAKYQASTKRILDAIRLKVPDRVPVVNAAVQRFALDYSGVTMYEAMTDFDKAFDAQIKFYRDFDLDGWAGADFIFPLDMFASLDWQRVRWPGHGVPLNATFQFVEKEYMPVEEIDEFLDDPSNWYIHKYLPRLSPVLAPFASLPPIHDTIMFYQGLAEFESAFTDERWNDTLKALQRGGKALADWFAYLARLDQEVSGELGIPHFLGAFTQVPFDVVSLFFRGWTGSVLDMYRRPDKLFKLMDKVLPWVTDYAVRNAEAYGHPIVELYIYKGADVFMSEEQFKTFYWPTLKAVIMALLEKGLIPWIWTQGTYDRHLKYFNELPRASCFVHLEAGTDIFKAKEVIGHNLCIEGNVPNSLLATGTPDQVREYCKKLIDICGKGGGYMMDFSALLDEAKPENLHAMIDFTKEYGKY